MQEQDASSISRPVRSLLGADLSLKARLARSTVWKARRATASRRVLPDFIVIGGQRCGSTSLHRSLARHPSIEASLRKEVHFFDFHFHRGIDWYRANFPLESKSAGRIAFETTPSYLTSADVPALMRSVVPDVKLIALLRDPVERTHSSWKFRMYTGSENRSFETAVEQELAGVTLTSDGLDDERNRSLRRPTRGPYLEESTYDEHFERWFEFFDRDQFLILESEAIFANPSEGLHEIETFLGIEHDPTIVFPHLNSTQRSSIDPALRADLSDYFAPHIERLTAITGANFSWL